MFKQHSEQRGGNISPTAATTASSQLISPEYQEKKNPQRFHNGERNTWRLYTETVYIHNTPMPLQVDIDRDKILTFRILGVLKQQQKKFIGFRQCHFREVLLVLFQSGLGSMGVEEGACQRVRARSTTQRHHLPPPSSLPRSRPLLKKCQHNAGHFRGLRSFLFKF